MKQSALNGKKICNAVAARIDQGIRWNIQEGPTEENIVCQKKLHSLAAPLQSILVNIAQRTNIVSRQDRADDQNQHYNHLEHVLHVVFHLSESWPSRRLPLPALSHQAAQGLGSG